MDGPFIADRQVFEGCDLPDCDRGKGFSERRLIE